MNVREQLCYTDAYAQTVEARVVAVDESGDAPLVVLDRTVFYPGGGGPAVGSRAAPADG